MDLLKKSPGARSVEELFMLRRSRENHIRRQQKILRSPHTSPGRILACEESIRKTEAKIAELDGLIAGESF